VNNLDLKISTFIQEHHVLSLSTLDIKNELSSCSVFYTFDEKEVCFVFASEEKTEHIQNILINEKVAASIHFETKEIGTIRGIQVKAIVSKAQSKEKINYLKAFPYAIAMKNLQLWKMKVISFKYTDNRLGFGKKVTWAR